MQPYPLRINIPVDVLQWGFLYLSYPPIFILQSLNCCNSANSNECWFICYFSYLKLIRIIIHDHRMICNLWPWWIIEILTISEEQLVTLIRNEPSITLMLLRLRETHNALQLPVFFFFSFFSFFCQPYPEYRGIRSNKLFYRPLNSWYNSVICSYKKDIFRVYSFSEEVAAKGNSLKSTW